MLQACLEAMNLQTGGTFVDVTFGGGGHSKAILENLDVDSRLIAFDQDPDAARNVLDDARFTFVPQNFRYLKRYLRLERAVPVQAILADLGVSSHQIDDAARGFSYRFDAKLDMRMGQAGRSAADIVNEVDEAVLADILYLYGEERASRRIARAIVKARPFETTLQLADVISGCLPRPRPGQAHPATRSFQALRIAVNEEYAELVGGLEAAERVLKPGGQLAVVTFHSVEDRIVKRFLQVKSDAGGGGSRHAPQEAAREPQFTLKSRKAIAPDADEIATNPRARSAKLRVARRTDAIPEPADPRVLGMPNPKRVF